MEQVIFDDYGISGNKVVGNIEKEYGKFCVYTCDSTNELNLNLGSRIASFSLKLDKLNEISIEECCDYYYRETLNKQEFQNFINELQQICNKME